MLDAAPGIHTETPIHQRPVEQPPILSQEQLSQEDLQSLTNRSIHIVDRFSKTMFVPKTSKPALHLNAFNTLLEAQRQARPATDEDLIKELSRIKDIIQAEEVAWRKRNFPTVGLEVEIEKDRLPFVDLKTNPPRPSPLIKAIERLGIGVKPELSKLNVPSELVLPPSFSAEVQNRMVFELRRAGIIPTEHEFTSLHVNLGYGDDFSSDGKNVDQDVMEMTHRISDLVTYGYLNENRILTRTKSNTTAVKYEDTVDIGADRFDITESRIEFRTPNIFGPFVYKLIKETQLLGALINPKTSAMKEVKQSFVTDVDKTLEYNQISSNLPQTDPKKAAEMLKDSEFVGSCRTLGNYYSRKVYDTVNNIRREPLEMAAD